MRKGLGAEGERSLFGLVSFGLRWSFFSTIAGRAGSLVMGIVLARLLTPKDFGLFAVAMVAFLAVASFNELGVSLAIVRWPGDVGRIAPTVTTLAIGSSTVLYVLCLVAAPLFASALGAPGATGVVRLMALCVLIDGLTSVPGALLQRSFRQDRRAVADLVNLTAGALVSIVLAVNGAGAWSLAWGRVAGNAASALALYALSPKRYTPGFDAGEARQLLAFGLPLAGSSLLVVAVLNIPYVVVGNLLGPVALGYYLLAFNLSSWPVNVFSVPVRTVSLAGFSRLLGDQASMRASFSRSLGWLMAVTLPVCVLLSVLATPVVRFVYGSKWAPAAGTLVFLALLAAFRVGLELAYDFLVALAKSRSLLWLQGLWLIALVPAVAIGAKLAGIEGVGLAQLIVALCVVTPAVLFRLRLLGVRGRDVWRNLARPLLAAGLSGLTAIAVRAVVHGDFPQLALAGTAAGAVYLLVMLPMIRLLPIFRPRLAAAGLTKVVGEVEDPQAASRRAGPHFSGGHAIQDDGTHADERPGADTEVLADQGAGADVSAFSDRHATR